MHFSYAENEEDTGHEAYKVHAQGIVKVLCLKEKWIISRWSEDKRKICILSFKISERCIMHSSTNITMYVKYDLCILYNNKY